MQRPIAAVSNEAETRKAMSIAELSFHVVTQALIGIGDESDSRNTVSQTSPEYTNRPVCESVCRLHRIGYRLALTLFFISRVQL